MLNKLKRTVIAASVGSVLVLSMAVAPAFAFIHDVVPAGDCAASDMAADNETAESWLIATGHSIPIQSPPAPDWCPGQGH